MADLNSTLIRGYLRITGDTNVSGSISEGGTLLINKYLGISSKAADSDKLDGHDSSYFINTSNIGSQSVNYANTADSASIPYGFNSRGTSDWSGVSGTMITDWSSSASGDIMFKDDSGKINVITDGRFYQGIDIYGASKRVLDEYDITHTQWGDSDTIDSQHADKFGWIYNSSDIGNSSGVTVNDLVSSGNSNVTFGMIYSSTDNPTGSSSWVHVWSQQWAKNTASSWVSQIAIGTENATGIWYRTNGSSSIVGKAWTRLIDSSNIGSQSVSYAASAGSANSVAWSNVSNPPTTISGYGITDCSLNSSTGAITIGSVTKTPIYSHQSLSGVVPYSGATGDVSLGAWGVYGLYFTDTYSNNSKIYFYEGDTNIGANNNIYLVTNNSGLAYYNGSEIATHYWVENNYLPLTGGTLNNGSNDTPLTIQNGSSNNSSHGAYLAFKDYSGTTRGFFSVDGSGKPIFYDSADREIITSATIGSQSVNYATTAGSAPASDVYSWAKASSKPSYTASEVGALPSSTTFVSTVNGSSGAITNVAKTNANNNFSTQQVINYSGDTPLYLYSTASNGECWVGFRNSKSTASAHNLGYIGTDGTHLYFIDKNGSSHTIY